MENEFGKLFLAFVVLINPFAALSIFLDITRNATIAQSRKVAMLSATTVFITILCFTLLGDLLLQALGISLGAFRIAGGILVLLIAISMMNGGGNPAKSTPEKIDGAFNGMASAVVPIAIPMIMGPGGISTVIIYSSSMKTLAGTLTILAVGLLLSIVCYLSLMAAGRLSKLLGETGLNVMNRIMGMLLAAVAVEIILSGMRAIFPKMFM
ncbi:MULTISPECIES: MarC family protein [unclassified Acinetobacter]|uniref:MarC family protein n=1 Tax=unclassified Acinetobacter TaxID=196816 RepID=UPI0035B71BDA